MAIVKMKKLRVMTMASQRDELLRGLLHLGCVEISEPDGKLADPAWAALLKRESSRLVSTRNEIADVNTALAAIKKYAQVKDGMFMQRQPVSEEEFLGRGAVEQARTVSRRVGELLQTISRLQSEESRLLARQASLAPWKALDMPLDAEGTAHVVYRMGVCPAGTDTAAVKAELRELAAAFYEISSDRQQSYCLLICHKADEAAAMEILRPRNFSVVTFQGTEGTAAENLDKLSRQLAENHEAQERATQEIVQSAEAKDALRLYADRLNADADRETNTERLLTDGTILFFEGWAPADTMKQVSAFLDRLGCAWESEDPTEEEYPQVPVKLKNNIFGRCMNVVTEMYSLPAYNSVDPNPLMAPFFILFFGIMMADMAYGILMVLGALFVLKKSKPREGTRNFMELVFWCGISTFIVGAMTGGFFGDFIPQILKVINPNSTFEMPALFTPLNDTVAIMLGSLVLGVIQVFTGMGVSVVKKFRRGQYIDALFDEFTWWIILGGTVLAIFGIGTVKGVPVVLVIGILMLVFGGTREAKGFGKVTKLVGLVYNGVTGYFSDILSYVRLMALMLSGSVIAQVFNTLAATFGNVILFIIISMIGNALNLALNLLGCYVHDLRLQCLEFFNRFYEEGGKPYKPLAIQTKYVDVIKEEH